MELEEFLEHPDQRIRLGAQFEVVKRKEPQIFENKLNLSEGLFGQLHAIWGLGQLIRSKTVNPTVLIPYFKDDQAHVRAQVAKVSGEAKFKEAYPLLIELLKDTSAVVQFFAAEAIGKLENPDAFPHLIHHLEKIKASDTHLRHALFLALSRISTVEQLIPLVKSPFQQVRIAAVIALRKQLAPEITAFLGDQDSLVLNEVARAIHDDQSIPNALPALASTLRASSPAFTEVFVRRAINANLRLGKAENAKTLAAFASQREIPIEWRKDALWALSYWGSPMNLDRVEGRFRTLPKGRVSDATEALSPWIETILQENNVDIRSHLIQVLGKLQYTPIELQLVALLDRADTPVPLKVSALKALAKLEVQSFESVVLNALKSDQKPLRVTGQQLLGSNQLSQEATLKALNQILAFGSIPEQQKALNSLGRLNTAPSKKILKSWLTKMKNNQLDPSLHLDLMEAIDSSQVPYLIEEKSAYLEEKYATNRDQEFEVCLEGGSIALGKKLFNNNNRAQCIRCHKVGKTGGAVGPELTKIVDLLSKEALLTSLIHPNERIAPGYGTIVVKLKDGNQKVGVLIKETSDALSLRIGDEGLVTVSTEEIADQELMPSGMFSMKDLLTKREIRDIMAYLYTLKGENINTDE